MVTELPVKSSRRPVILAVLITALVFIAGGGVAAWVLWPKEGADEEKAHASIMITGSITVPKAGAFVGAEGQACSPGRGYDDIPSSQVVVTDATGTVIATSSLRGGTVVMDPNGIYNIRHCSFSFIVSGVPGGHPFYGVQVGRRGEMTYSRDQLVTPIRLTLN